MPTISGSLNLVTDRPVDSISEVWVRARETRGQGDGLIVGVNDRVSVTDGAVEFTALPGAAVLVLVQNGMPLETLPMVIGDEAQQSLRLVVQAGEVADSTDRRVIEQFAAEIAANTVRAEQYRTEAASSASAASASETAAATSASKAKTSETKAKTSETNAKASETNAASSADSAESQQQSALSHSNNAATEADKAADSAAAAKTSETNAASSASASASSASASETQADNSAASATQAEAARDAAKASETAAAGSAAAAKTSETNAATSESSANTHRADAAEQATAASQSATQAAEARDAAQASQSAAKTSENNAAAHEQAAALSESNAAIHETHAGAHATAAAGSATEAEGHADRAEIAADPDNLRDEVMQQIADLVDGAPEHLDTIREVAEYAEKNRDITDQLNAAIGNKADKSHTHTQDQVTGLPAALDGKADKSHTHTTSQVTGLDTALNGKANASHTHTTSQVTGLDDVLDGKADKSHTHAWASITGRPDIPVTDAGYNGHTSDDLPSSYPSGVSIIMSNGHFGWNAAVAASTSDYLDSSFVVVLTMKNSRYTQSTTQMLFSYDSVSRPVYIRKYTGEANGWSNFRKFTDDGHKHDIADITGLDSLIHRRPALFSGSGAPPTSIAGAVAGDWWLNTSTLELHKITGVEPAITSEIIGRLRA